MRYFRSTKSIKQQLVLVVDKAQCWLEVTLLVAWCYRHALSSTSSVFQGLLYIQRHLTISAQLISSLLIGIVHVTTTVRVTSTKNGEAIFRFILLLRVLLECKLLALATWKVDYWKHVTKAWRIALATWKVDYWKHVTKAWRIPLLSKLPGYPFFFQPSQQMDCRSADRLLEQLQSYRQVEWLQVPVWRVAAPDKTCWIAIYHLFCCLFGWQVNALASLAIASY
jgi:hypothetical protein